jgi:hypothetical protein
VDAVLNAAPAIPARVPAPVFNANNKRRRGMVAEIAKRSGVDPADVEQWVKRDLVAVYAGGSPSSKDLDETGWAHVLVALQERIDALRGGDRPPRAMHEAHPGSVPSGEQKKMIAQLIARLDRDPTPNPSPTQGGALAAGSPLRVGEGPGVRSGADKAAAVCRRQFHHDRPHTISQASAVIEALKSMVCIRLQLFDRAALLDPARLNANERSLRGDFLRESNPNRLAPGGILWMADLCDRHGVPLVGAHRDAPAGVSQYAPTMNPKPRTEG